MNRRLVTFLATGAYAGYSPLMPGTFGSLWGLVAWYLVSGLTYPVQFVAAAALFIAAVFVSGEAERDSGQKDPSSIVCDEVAGLLVAGLFMPFTLFNAILVFLLFRFFDILKPWPIAALESRLKGGLGVVADDIMAGIFANILARAVILYLVHKPL